MSIMGVVMAGGGNTRYGGLKAFAEVGERRIVDRVVSALRSVTDDVVVVANDHAAYASLGLLMRSDDIAHGAALAGLVTALRWSEERGHAGILAVACDMPFVTGGLLGRLRDTAEAQTADAVVPESAGRRGIEPLCALYGNSCLPAIESAIARNDLRMIGFHDAITVARVPHDEVQTLGDPAILFMNVNTPEELAAARVIAAEHGL